MLTRLNAIKEHETYKPMYESVKSDFDNIVKNYSPLFDLSNIDSQYDIMKALANLNDNIFFSTCLNKVFTLFAKNSMVEFDINYLNVIVTNCLKETDDKKITITIYKLLRNIRYFKNTFTQYNVHHQKVKPLFDMVLNKAKAIFDKNKLLVIMKGLLTKNKQVHYNREFENFLYHMNKMYSLKDINSMIKQLHTRSIVDDQVKPYVVNQYVRDLIVFYDADRIDLKNIKIEELDLYSILSENSKFAYFLTNLFTNIKTEDASTMNIYMSLYIYVNNFRIKYLSDYDFGLTSDLITKHKFKELFVQNMDEKFTKTSSETFKANLYYLKLVNYNNNIKKLESSDDIKSKCHIDDDLRSITINKNFKFKVNNSYLKKLIDNNDMVSENMNYLYSQALICDKNKDRYVSTDETDPDGRLFKQILADWLILSKTLISTTETATRKVSQPSNKFVSGDAARKNFDVKANMKEQGWMRVL